MTSHPHRQAIYRVQLINGKFDHVATKRAAVARAVALANAPQDTSSQELERHWGVTFTRVSASVARSVGF